MVSVWIKKLNYKLIEWQKRKKTTVVFGYPYWLTIDPCSACNLECRFCPTGQRRGTRPGMKLKFDDFKNIIDKIGPYLIHIDFCNWGEPLLNKELAKMAAYAKKYGPSMKVDTNLSIPMDEKEAEEIITSGLERITVSLDGASRETYEIYRKGGDFDMVLHNLRLMVAVKKHLRSQNPHIHWQFLVFKHNEHEIERAKGIAREIGVDSIGFTAPFCDPDWASSKEEFNRYFTKEENREFKPVDSCCEWLWDGITINSDGSVSPCCSVEEKKDDFGSFYTKPFWMLWNGKEYRRARKFIKDRVRTKRENICTKCDHIGASNHSKVKI